MNTPMGVGVGGVGAGIGADGAEDGISESDLVRTDVSKNDWGDSSTWLCALVRKEVERGAA